VIDHPGSSKAWLDQLLLFRPMRRLRAEQCRKASAIVTPLPSILPGTVPPEKIHPIHWGANVETFKPDLMPRGTAAEVPIPPDARVVVFSGSFRPWHGADVLVRAGAKVLETKEGSKAFFVFLGTGPAHSVVVEEIERAGIAKRCHVSGAVPYELMPYYLARCHIGVAPYQPSRHGQMQLGFYWSPLKIFEYMAMGLPVVALDIDPLREIIREGLEGRLVEESDEGRWAEAITELVASPERCDEMGRSARKRVVSNYSWQVHCEKLESVLEAVVRS
jgi:glycosyltransferase involved in cell wall biosynthesis